MKLLYIAQYFYFPEDSSSTRAYDLSTSFVKQGIDVTVVTSFNGNSKDPKWQFLERDGLKIHRLNCPYDNRMGFWRRIKSFCSFLVNASRKALKVDCDVVLATSTPLTVGVPALVVHAFRRKPYIFEVRDVWPGVPIAMGYFKNAVVRRFLYWFEKHVYKKASAIIPLSTGMDENIKRRYPNDKSVVIPNISEIKRFAGIQKTVDIDVPAGKKVLLYAGTFGNVNGLGYVIELASFTLRHNPDVWFYLVGMGKEKEDNIRQAEALGVYNKNVFFFDPVKKSDLPYLYSIADVGSSFVINIPALFDNSANKFFDTLAAGRPMVINHGGWQADVISQYNCGYVLPPVIDEQGALAFVDYMTNESLLDEQGKNALELATSQYSLEIAVEKYLGVFRAVCGNV